MLNAQGHHVTFIRIDEIRREIKRNVFSRDNHCCAYCGSPDNLTVHHVIPKKNGGEYSVRNLLTLCMKCHVELHARPRRKHKRRRIKLSNVDPTPDGPLDEIFEAYFTVEESLIYVS